MTEVHITDHAIIRYLERVKGFNIEAIKREMMSPGVEVAVEFGCETVRLGNGARLKLRGSVVQTVLAKEMKLGKGQV